MRLCATNHVSSKAHIYSNAIFTRYCDTGGRQSIWNVFGLPAELVACGDVTLLPSD